MAPSPLADRVKRFFGIDPELRLDDSSYYEDGSYVEHEPSVRAWLFWLLPTGPRVKAYLYELFPFVGWIFHYNFTWLLGDFIAGVTVGFVVVPQGMAYAQLAQLPPEYGLYTSFVGFLLYWAFATSKDITIGTVAVMSQIVGGIVISTKAAYPDLQGPDIARSLALVSGLILFALGIFRLGYIVELISLTAIASFMTGSALNIAAGQVPNLLGITSTYVNTRDPTYLVIINTLKSLPRSKLDAAMGLTALFALYFIRWFCSFMGKRQPSWARTWFFISTLRMAFVVILYILVAWGVNRGISNSANAKFRILGTVPSGFQHTGAPRFDTYMLNALAPNIPTTIIVLLIEHIAISKSFGRVNNYIINPSQELVAIGFSNIFGPFLGGYPATGSFSRTAIKAKAGVRTPLAGIFTAVVVLLALYALTSVFFYIPQAALAAIIIHAVGDLITPPKEVYKFWLASPIEVVIFFAGVLVSVFTTIDNGIYTTVSVSMALYLFRAAKSPGRFPWKGECLLDPRDTVRGATSVTRDEVDGAKSHPGFVPLDRTDLSNPEVEIKSPYPGVFIYRFGEGLSYLNCARHLDNLTVSIYKQTRKTEFSKYTKLGDRPWNDPGPRRGADPNHDEISSRPTLRAVILDFTGVNHLDVTSIQALVDIRNQFNRYAKPDKVEWHFASVSNKWSKRALVGSGFGLDTEYSEKSGKSGSGPLIAVADAGPGDSVVNVTPKPKDIEAGEITAVVSEKSAGGRLVPLYGINRPFFHIDVETALKSTLHNLEGKFSDSN